jgi:hypothetical protein
LAISPFVIGGGILAFGAVVIMAAARTGPDDAVSNISRWLNRLGFGSKEWMTNPNVDTWAFRIAAIVFLLGIGGVILPLISASADKTGDSIGVIHDNGGIITQGQHGDNTMSK